VVDPDVTPGELDRDSGEILQSLRRQLGVRSFGINLIVLQPRQRLRIHAHELQEEVYLVLEGRLTVLVEGLEHPLGPDQILRVGPAVRRQLVNANQQRVVVLALGASGDHQSRDARACSSWDEPGPGRPPQEVPLPDDLPGA
jgi:mannose-6-phosphate isomerase-like protein (cupin superfamily)